MFSQENPESIGLFEKILFSVIEDIQKYQKEINRLEISYQRLLFFVLKLVNIHSINLYVCAEYSILLILLF